MTIFYIFLVVFHNFVRQMGKFFNSTDNNDNIRNKVCANRSRT